MHANIRNNEIIDFNSKYLDEDITTVQTTQAIYELYQNDTRSVIYQGGEIIKNPEWDNIYLEQKKQEKIEENDKNRDEKLNGGVTYNNVLFDSDTDQKINLSETIRDMSDSDTIVWYGIDNTGLLCCKADLVNIGEEIRNLTKHCWEMNAYIKEQIENAQNLEELENVIINYEDVHKISDL